MTEIKILGTGCPRCKRLERLVMEVCQKNGITASINKVKDLDKIMDYGVMVTPSLVVNGKVVAAGRIPKAEEIVGWLEE